MDCAILMYTARGNITRAVWRFVAYHFNNQLINANKIRLFEGSDGYADGEQRRDFVYVEDTVDLKLWLTENPYVCGIFNVGTGPCAKL